MAKRYLVVSTIAVVLLSAVIFKAAAQQDSTRLHVVVNLVQLNVAVTDSKGNYVTDLRPSDFVVTEDSIPGTIATFEGGKGPTKRIVDLKGPGIAEAGFPAARPD